MAPTYEEHQQATIKFWVRVIGAALLFIVLGCGTCAYVGPKYSVWQQGLVGQAELAKAEYNRQIKTLEAKQQLESSKSLADAEVVRAEGVAKANKIIGDSLKNNESYLRYLWIQSLDGNSNQTVVYVPTESSLPILESTRLKEKSAP